MDGGQVGVLEEGYKVSLGGFLESTNSGRLETEIGLEVLGNLTDETLEGKLTNQKLRGLLVATDLTESDLRETRLVKAPKDTQSNRRSHKSNTKANERIK